MPLCVDWPNVASEPVSEPYSPTTMSLFSLFGAQVDSARSNSIASSRGFLAALCPSGAPPARNDSVAIVLMRGELRAVIAVALRVTLSAGDRAAERCEDLLERLAEACGVIAADVGEERGALHAEIVDEESRQHGTLIRTPSSTYPDVTKKGDYIFRMCFIDTLKKTIEP